MATERSVVIPEITDDQLASIERIGLLRAPNEACGLLLMSPHRGRTIIELPNRSLTPQDSYQFHGTDAKLELEGYDDGVIVWHTHPGGGIGPSRNDMRTRHPEFWYLVVALTDKGPLPTFF